MDWPQTAARVVPGIRPRLGPAAARDAMDSDGARALRRCSRVCAIRVCLDSRTALTAMSLWTYGSLHLRILAPSRLNPSNCAHNEAFAAFEASSTRPCEPRLYVYFAGTRHTFAGF
jgi:hypothetical protein